MSTRSVHRHRPQPVVTALRARGKDKIEVILDGTPWRVIPIESAAAARLAVGVTIDRQRACDLSRSLRRVAAVSTAARALRYRDHTVVSLGQRLEERGIREHDAAAALDVLENAGLVDDRRLAFARAAVLAGRGWGNGAIVADLEARGVPATAIDEAISALESAQERVRDVVARRGRSAATWRWLATHGFEEDDISAVLADLSHS